MAFSDYKTIAQVQEEYIKVIQFLNKIQRSNKFQLSHILSFFIFMQQSQSIFENIIIINLARRYNKKKSIISKLNEAEIKCDIDFFSAIDGHNLNEKKVQQMGFHYYESMKMPDDSIWHLTFGEVACAISHYQVWEKIVRENRRCTLILEDDAIFVKGFGSKLQEILTQIQDNSIDYDLLYLSRDTEHTKYPTKIQLPKEERISKNLVIPQYCHWLCAYVLKLEGAEKLLATDFCQHLIPVDMFIPAMYSSHYSTSILKHYSKFELIRALAVTPNLIVQEGCVSDTNDSRCVPKSTSSYFTIRNSPPL